MINREKPDIGYFEGTEHIYPLRIFYEDTDFSGFVYYANYLRFFERGRSCFFSLAGIQHSDLLQANPPMAFAVRRYQLDYRRAATIDDALTIYTRFYGLKGARISVSQIVRRGEDVLVTGQGEVACIDLNGRPRRAGADLVEKLKPYLSSGPHD